MQSRNCWLQSQIAGSRGRREVEEAFSARSGQWYPTIAARHLPKGAAVAVGNGPFTDEFGETPMNDEMNYEAGEPKFKREPTAKMRQSRSAHTKSQRKKAALTHGGTHQRKNKHWSW